MLLSALVAIALAAIHILAGRMRFLAGTPRSRWLSAAGGASVAYIFLHLLPDLAAAHERQGIASETPFFLLALVGLVFFYGIERHVRRARRAEGEGAARGVFWVHTGSFALYNLLIGYLLLHREETGPASLLLFGTAMGFHFLSSDYGMRLDHARDYDRIARWVLAAAVLAGWAVGAAVEVPRMAVDALFAVLAGGVVLNVMKEELPEEREARFGAFLAGTVAYGAILLLLG
jgi:hypothetical protein